MSAQSPVLHIVFNMSAAKDLRDALRKAERAEKVAAFPDDLSYGPITPPDADIRARWEEEELGQEYPPQLPSLIETFWRTALAGGARRLVWVSRRSVSDYSGFLEWLWRAGDADFEIIDLTDAQIVPRGRDGQQLPPLLGYPLAAIPSETIVRNALWDLARPITTTERKNYRSLWYRLRTENAPLRVLVESELASAPISHFDPLLISCVTTEWRKAMRVVGEAFAWDMDQNCFQTNFVILCARLRALVQARQLEISGDLWDLRNAKLRSPQT